MRGEATPKDTRRAEKLLLAAVQPRPKYEGSGTNLPNQYAAYLLGKLYLSEDGVPKDTEKAAQFFAEAAEQGNQYAQYQLGKMLLYGKEIERDVATGIVLLSASAAQGNQYAQKVLDGYYRFQGNAKVSAAIGSLRLLGRLSQIMKNRLDEESRRDGSVGLIDRKLRREIESKREAHGLRMG
jgi:TPR repeat protein